ncbi:uncharacterized protein V1510DRAFT_404674 [Dipodascopsis tothii]|uniref:uncharacterized protein n=1 Tax=Dipodascopsis tothii TaxID=44089 RepID=UPI0034CF8DC2
MASYEDDHNIKPQPAARPAAGRPTLAHQNPELAAFFSTERPATAADYGQLARAFQELDSSPVAERLLQQLTAEAADGTRPAGVSQAFIDALDRVPKKRLRPTDSCAICASAYLDDPYPLVVALPCNPLHHFDLECIAPWLRLHTTCPLCRKDVQARAPPPPVVDDEEPWDDTYG